MLKKRCLPKMRFAMVAILLSLLLASCDQNGPLAKSDRPDLVRSYRAGVKAEVTKKEDIDRLVWFFGNSERSWRRYWVTTPSPEVMTTFEKDRKNVASLLVGPDWIIATALGADAESYSTKITKEEHKELLRLLGFTAY